MSAVLLSLDALLQRPDVWRGDRLAAADVAGSGFAGLDAVLPGGGWPRGGMTELLLAGRGVGELSLLLPALQACAAEAPVAVVAPPGALHAPAWAAALPLSRVLVVQAAKGDVAWSAELLLGSGALGALLVWLPADVTPRALRRLQLAAEGRRSLAFLFRPESCARVASPAPLRLLLSGVPQGLQVRVLKRRGPVCAQPLIVPVARPVWRAAKGAAPKAAVTASAVEAGLLSCGASPLPQPLSCERERSVVCDPVWPALGEGGSTGAGVPPDNATPARG